MLCMVPVVSRSLVSSNSVGVFVTVTIRPATSRTQVMSLVVVLEPRLVQLSASVRPKTATSVSVTMVVM